MNSSSPAPKTISFVLAAHNEEKLIRRALDNLLQLPYELFEVLVGLDGCTDNTEAIVKEFCKKSCKFKSYTFNPRLGKTGVINNLVPEARGEIIIIHDADWLFKVKAGQDLYNLLALFNDAKTGGIADVFPLHYLPERLRKKSLLELGVVWSSYVWMDYIKKNYTKRVEGLLFLDKQKLRFPMVVNIFRKDLYKKNISLGDDFERCLDILESGYEVVVPRDETLPRMISYGEKITFSGLVQQKVRTAMARQQIRTKYRKGYGFDAGFYLYLLRFMPRLNFKENLGLLLWIIAFVWAEIKQKFKSAKTTQEGWKMRLER
jgi:glycosyltransferase involved in cell wall biosynthesis